MEKDSTTGIAQTSHDENGSPQSHLPERKSELDGSIELRHSSDVLGVVHNPLKVSYFAQTIIVIHTDYLPA